MTTTFYGVLGVGPDADADAIRRGYRERAAEVHPDVNDDPDADSQFRRLTTAKETLLDESERDRYDRLGHASYVRHHAAGSAWNVEETAQPPTDAAAGDAPAERRATDPSTSASRRKTGTGSGVDATVSDHRRTESTSGSRRGGSTAGATTDAAPRANGESRSPWNTRTSGHRTAADSGSDGSVSGTYTRSSFWDSQRVGERYTATGSAADPLPIRLFHGLRAVGSWTLVHVLFISLAIGTSWYVYAVVLAGSTRSLPLVLVLIGEVGLAVVLSTVHVLTRIYR